MCSRFKGPRHGPSRDRATHSYLEPRIAQAELWIVLLWRNFGLRVRTTTPVPPAERMRLAKPGQALPDLLHEAWTFRLDTTCASRMSRWLRP